jgi:superfamily II DNA/RNA helicase
MDLSRFFIDPALFAGAEASSAYRSVFFEKLLSSLFENKENLFVRSDIQRDRAEIFAFPALYWLGYPEKARDCAKALYLCIDDQAAATAFEAAKRLAAGFEAAAPALLDAASGGAGAKDAPLLFASVNAFHDLIATEALSPREYGFVIVDQADQIAELPGEFVRKIQGGLLPSWERKTLVIAARTTPKAKNFAWDFADNPKELKLAETMGLASTTSTQSVKLEDADKIRYLLKLLEERGDHHLCVFCNLKSTAAELSARLDMNGVATDYIGGNLNPDRKNQIVAKALSWTGKRREAPAEAPAAEAPAAEAPAEGAATAEGEAAAVVATEEIAAAPDSAAPEPEAAPVASRFAKDSFVLVLTDDGAKGLAKPEFVTVVNYDIPLEPEFYFERLIFLKRQDPDALLFNLVCDRYMYGIPAIEHTIDAPLPLATPDASAFPEDQSAGKPIELPEPRMRGRDGRDGRHGRDGYGRDRFASDDRRDRGDRTDRSRDDRFARDDRPRGEDRLRGEDRPQRNDRPPRDSSGRGGRSDRPDNRRGDGRRPSERQAERQGGQGNGPDPYALSMEERLALYKRKYGRNIEAARPEGANPSGGRDGQRRNDGKAGKGRPRGEPGSRPRRPAGDGAEKREAAPREAPETKARRDEPRQAPPPAAPAAPQVPAASPEAQGDEASKPKGFLGKLQDLFGQRKD